MHASRRITLGFAGAALALCLSVAPALAETGSVSVRVEGISETLLPPTQATTTTVPMTKDGNPAHACPGTSALAALNTATSGNWDGPWNKNFSQYELFTIAGETHLFEPASEANFFWAFWLDERESEIGACEAQVQPGDRVLFFPACFGAACPPPQTPLGIEAPATANVGEAVPVRVKIYTSAGEAAAKAGANLTGASAAATTDGAGTASVVFTSAGIQLLRASAPGAVRTEVSVCVHAGNDGTCGTTAPGAPGIPSVAAPASRPSPYTGPFALVANINGLIEGHVYPHHRGPRLLAGTIHAHSPVTSASLELRRRNHGRCYAYDGTRGRFHRARCGSGTPFNVSSGGTFSYLLPAALGPGRYVLDVQATDAAGNHVALARGTSRIVFYVR
jgi:hypothetical protein